MTELQTLANYYKGKIIKDVLYDTKISCDDKVMDDPKIDDIKFVYLDKSINVGLIDDSYIYLTYNRTAVIMNKKTGFINISYICKDQVPGYIDSWMLVNKDFIANICTLTKMKQSEIIIKMKYNTYALANIAIKIAESISKDYAMNIKTIIVNAAQS